MKFLYYFTIILIFLGCGGGQSSTSSQTIIFDPNAQPVTTNTLYKPTINTSWQIQLQGDLNLSYNVDLYDVDLFDTSVDTINSLKNSGKKVVCYFSAGTYENWRSDVGLFPVEALGNDLENWAGEKWLDISNEKLAPIIKSRLDLAVQKGCNGVDPDNLDGYTNNTGFNLTNQHQLAYNKFIANEARKRGLTVGLKNDLNQIQELEPFFDFSINEQCNIYNECNLLTPFIEKNKPVFSLEYDDKYINNTNNERDIMCTNSISLGFKTLVMPNNLDGSFRISCDEI